MTGLKNKNRAFCLLLVCVLMLSVFSFGVFAEDTMADENTVGETADLLVAAAETTAAETTAAETTAAETTAAETTAATTTASSTTASTVAKTWFEKNEGLVITLGVIVALVLIFFILWFASSKFKAWAKKFAKDYKSEFKKLIWPTKQQLFRNSVVVVLSIIVFGALLAFLDWGLTKGVYGLKDLVEYIKPVN